MEAVDPVNSSTTHWRRTVLWAGAPLIIGALNELALNVALPTIRSEFDVEVTTAGWMLIAFLIADAAVLIAAGRYGDKVGRRRTAMIGLALIAVGSVFCALAPTFALLIVGRVIEGVGMGILFSGLLAIIVDVVPAESRGRAFGLWAFIGAIAVLASPIVGGVLAEQVSWRWILALNAFVSVVALVTARRCIPPHTPRATRPAVKPARVFASPNFVAGTAVTTLSYAAVALTWLMLVFFLTVVSGFGPTTVGLMFVAYGVWWLVLPPVTGRLADRVGVRIPMLIGALLGTVGYGILALAANTENVFLIATGLSLLGIGVAFIIPGSNAASMGHVPPEIRGDASGINMTARIIGSIAGLAVSTALLDSIDRDDIALSAQMAWGLATALMFVALLITAFSIRSIAATTKSSAGSN